MPAADRVTNRATARALNLSKGKAQAALVIAPKQIAECGADDDADQCRTAAPTAKRC